MTAKLHLQPLSLWQTMAFFGLPWLLFMLAIYLLLPTLARLGVPLFLNFLLCLGGPLALLLIAAGVAYQREGQPWRWPAFRTRFRLGPMPITAWLWALGLAINARSNAVSDIHSFLLNTLFQKSIHSFTIMHYIHGSIQEFFQILLNTDEDEQVWSRQFLLLFASCVVY